MGCALEASQGFATEDAQERTGLAARLWRRGAGRGRRQPALPSGCPAPGGGGSAPGERSRRWRCGQAQLRPHRAGAWVTGAYRRAPKAHTWQGEAKALAFGFRHLRGLSAVSSPGASRSSLSEPRSWGREGTGESLSAAVCGGLHRASSSAPRAHTALLGRGRGSEG